MTDDRKSRDATPAACLISKLPPATNGYRRKLYAGRGICIYFDRHQPNEWPDHSHEQTQVSALLEPLECRLCYQARKAPREHRTIQGPAVWVIPPGICHGLSLPQEADMITLFIEKSFLREALGRDAVTFKLRSLAELSGRDTVVGQLSKTFRRLCRGPDRKDEKYVESIGTVYGTHLMQVMFGREVQIDRRGGLPDEAQLKLMRFVEEHLGDRLDLDILGQNAGYSASHLGRLFKKSLGLTPHDYVMHRRVARAEEFLEKTDKKEIEIAGLCGFSDDTHMARWFRRVLACTPSEFRKQRGR